MGRKPVLDTRALDDGAGPAMARGTVEERYTVGLPLAGMITERLARYGARICLDGPSASLLLGFATRSPWLHFASPRADVEELLRAMTDAAVRGWSERFRDYRVRLEDESQLDADHATLWEVRGIEVSMRLCDDWQPISVAVGDIQVAVLPVCAEPTRASG